MYSAHRLDILLSDKKEITVEAELMITSSLGIETVRTFARAWRRTLELPTPTRGQFKQWARKEDKKK